VPNFGSPAKLPERLLTGELGDYGMQGKDGHALQFPLHAVDFRKLTIRKCLKKWRARRDSNTGPSA